MCWYKNKRAISLEEYRTETAELKKLAMLDLMEGMKEDEVLTVMNNFRDDDDTNCIGVWNHVFKNPNHMLEYIRKESSFLADDNEESIKDRMWWEVVRYRLCCGEYQEYMKYLFSVNGEIFGYYLNSFPDNLSSERILDIDEGAYLFHSPHNVILPYETGDILKVNTLPFTKPVYIVYGGEGEKSERIDNDFCYYHWCLYISEDRNGLAISDLSHNCFLDYRAHCFTHVGDCEKVSVCPEPLITKASKLLKENPDLWTEWFQINMRHRKAKDEGGLEQWIFNASAE